MTQHDRRVAKPDLDGSEDDIEWADMTEQTLVDFEVQPDTLPPSRITNTDLRRSPWADRTIPSRDARPGGMADVLSFPRQLAGYEVLIPISSGATTTVFLARLPVVGGAWRYVALKLIHAHALRDNPALQRALHEVKLAGALRQANIVSFIDTGESIHGVFFVMEYVEGESLSGLMPRIGDARQQTPIPIAMRIMLDVLQGLEAIHATQLNNETSRAFVHGDVAPANVLVGMDGVAKLIDLGIDKVFPPSHVTPRQSALDRLRYKAPEQVAGVGVDRRSDVWAAGAIMWELLAGRRLFPDNSLRSLVDRMRVAPPGLRTVRKDVPVALERVIASALAPNVRDRCPTATELKARLREVSVGAVAEAAEVGALVTRIVAPKLAQRDKAVRELLRYRRALSDLEQTAMRELADEDSTTRSMLQS